MSKTVIHWDRRQDIGTNTIAALQLIQAFIRRRLKEIGEDEALDRKRERKARNRPAGR